MLFWTACHMSSHWIVQCTLSLILIWGKSNVVGLSLAILRPAWTRLRISFFFVLTTFSAIDERETKMNLPTNTTNKYFLCAFYIINLLLVYTNIYLFTLNEQFSLSNQRQARMSGGQSETLPVSISVDPPLWNGPSKTHGYLFRQKSDRRK